MKYFPPKLRHLYWILPLAAVLQFGVAIAASFGPPILWSNVHISRSESLNSPKGTLYLREVRIDMFCCYEFSRPRNSQLGGGTDSPGSLAIANELPPDCWDDNPRCVYLVFSGWPMYSLSGEVSLSNSGTRQLPFVATRSWWYSFDRWDNQRFDIPRGIPTRVAPFAALVNTLVWTIPLTMVVVVSHGFIKALQVTRRTWRFKHSKCPSCNYEITESLVSHADRCPECGEQISKQSPLLRMILPPLSYPYAPHLLSLFFAALAFMCVMFQLSVAARLGCALAAIVVYAIGFVRGSWVIVPLAISLTGSVVFFAGVCNYFNVPDEIVTTASIFIGIGLPIVFMVGRLHKNIIAQKDQLNESGAT